MGVCILGCGDCGNKSDVKNTTNISKINQTMTNMVSNTSSSSNVKQFNSQSVEVDVGGDLIDCDFSVDQKMVANQKVSVSLDYSSTKALRTQIDNALKAANETSIKQKSAFLQTASNASSTANTLNEAISNLVTTNISDTVTNSLSQLMENLQNGKLRVGGNVNCKGKPLHFNQEMLTTQISDMLTKALTGTTVSALVTNTTDVANKDKVDQEGEGISGAISALFKGLSGLVSSAAFAIIAPIIAIVIIIAILMFVFKGSISKIAEKKAGVSFGTWLFGRKKFGFGRRR